MNNKLKLLLSILAVSSVMGVAASCGGEAPQSSNSPTESSTPSTPDESTPNESSPDESTPDESTPDESTPDESTPDEVTKYTVKFVDEDGTTISEEEYEEGAAVTAPADPTKAEAEGYSYAFAGWDKEVTDANGDVTYTATYTKTAIEYTIAFTHPRTGMILAAPIKYTVENVAEIVFPEVPAELAMEGYDVSWDKTPADITIGDVNVSPVFTVIEYQVVFTHPRTGMILAAPITYTVETMGEIVFPEVPAELAMDGYSVAWDKTPADVTVGGLNVSIVMTPNTYKITYDAGEGSMGETTQEVTYGSEYTLATATAPKSYQEFLGWADEEGNQFVASETWNVASDVTLKAIYSEGVVFESLETVPTYMSAADTTESLSIVELNGNKVLEIKSNSNGTTTADRSPALKVTLDFLKSFFDDENVDYVAFDAKAGTTTINNFRRVTLRSDGFKADCYETDLTYTHNGATYPTTGIRADSFKTFYFSRADYEAWVAQGVTSEKFICAGNFNQGDSIYVDNIRPVTAEQRKAGIGSFESGGVRINDGGQTLLFYTLDQGGTWQFNMQVASGQTFSNVGYTNENVTDGIRALQFTKAAGTLNLNFTSGKAFYTDVITATGYYAVDVYVPEGADTTMNYHTTNWAGVTLKKGAWNTIYVKGNNVIVLNDTTGGTYKIDNIRAISEYEYNLAALGFETNASGLRTKELDSSAHSSPSYYYGGVDHNNNTYSFAFVEGNGASDVEAIKNVYFENEITHSGTQSLAVEKGSGYVYATLRPNTKAYELLSGGFTFWMYSTVEIDGVNTSNFFNGINGKFNDGEGIVIPANTWVQVTVTAADINSGGRFLIIQGSTAGTIYFDDFQPLN